MYRLLVVGDSYEAHTITRYFRSKNQRVFCLIGHSEAADSIRGIGAEPIFADLPSGELSQPLPAVQFVIFVQPNQGEKDPYLKGVSNFLGRLKRNPAPTFLLCVTGLEIWGRGIGDWVDESTIPQPDTPWGEALLKAERRILLSGYAAGILRIGKVYGNHDSFVKAAGDFEKIDQYLSFLHEDDLMGVMPRVLKKIKAGGVLIASEDEPLLESEVNRYLNGNFGQPVKKPVGFETGIRGVRLRNTALKNLGYRFAHRVGGLFAQNER
ncbi:MAG: hypothetical protein JW893_04335 [Candidatus Omnitrophica bacterium]|nr:hypothetical protein [Candidatus Omnitrophota bacterium]